MWVPFTCYYHLFSRDDLLECAARNNVSRVSAMGDSQVREVVAQLRLMTAMTGPATKFERVGAVVAVSLPTSPLPFCL